MILRPKIVYHPIRSKLHSRTVFWSWWTAVCSTSIIGPTQTATSFIYLFVNLQVGAQLILLPLRDAQMTLAAFQEQFSFKFSPKTVIGKFWRFQCARQRVPDRWSTHRKGTRTGSHCSCPRYSKFQMHRRTQKPTTRNRRNSDAVIDEVDGSATMETPVNL